MTNRLTTGIIIALLLAVIAASGYFWYSTDNLAPEYEYQAVFLDNGQVYFGKVSNEKSKWVNLTDIYYLQLDQELQGEGTENTDMTLVKLGEELHGPTDQMQINRDKIMFMEDLKSDSDVVKAINQHQNQ